MGLRDWLAANVSGPSGYGAVMAREAVKNGVALGRYLYLGHGSRIADSDLFVCQDDDQMKALEFVPYCTDDLNRPPMEDGSELSKHTRVAGIAFAVQCSMTAASNFMKPMNASAFNRSLGGNVKQELLNLSMGITADDVMHYLRLVTGDSGITTVLDLERPGTGDALSLFLAEARKYGNGAVAFKRSGVQGFDIIAKPLAEETTKSVVAATQKFHW